MRSAATRQAQTADRDVSTFLYYIDMSRLTYPHELYRARQGRVKEALDAMSQIAASGYAASDIIQTLFRVTRSYDMPEPEKLELLREIGFSHMRISEGLNSQLQLLGCVSRMCALQQNKKK
jgi:DNA polymerase III delta prime subunit